MSSTIIRPAVPSKISAHVGQIGDRVRIEGVVCKMIGSRPVLHIIRDVDGNEFTFRA